MNSLFNAKTPIINQHTSISKKVSTPCLIFSFIEIQKTEITSETQFQGDTKYYLRAKVQCAKDVELQLMVSDVFTDPEFVEATSDESPSHKCLPTQCIYNRW